MQMSKGLLLAVMPILMSSMGGCMWSVMTDYVQTVEMVVSDLNAHPASELNVYQYGSLLHLNPSPENASHFATREAELQKHTPGLLRHVNHHPDAAGVVVVPVFHTYWDHGPFPLKPLIFPPGRVENGTGIAGSPCTIAVDDGENLDTMFVQMQPGAITKGEHFQIEVRALSPPKTYILPDK